MTAGPSWRPCTLLRDREPGLFFSKNRKMSLTNKPFKCLLVVENTAKSYI
nr:MAG TPA: hypothetical protein [Caudoviricetes sp.]